MKSNLDLKLGQSEYQTYELYVKKIIINSNFELVQCYCSCSLNPEIHDKSCPNYGKEKPPKNTSFEIELEKDGELIVFTGKMINEKWITIEKVNQNYE